MTKELKIISYVLENNPAIASTSMNVIRALLEDRERLREALKKYAHLNMVAYKGQVIERVDPTPIAQEALAASDQVLKEMK